MSDNKPNILLIITDHHAFHAHYRLDEFGFEYNWPRFEEFSSQGINFNRAYSVCPICTPARASMITGIYPSRHGLRFNTENQSNTVLSDFRQSQKLYSHYLSKAGYRNSYIGKWHCGHERIPVDYGIEGWSLPDYGKVYMSEAYRKYTKFHGLDDATAYIEHNLNNPEWEGKKLVLHDPSPWKFMNGSGILLGPPKAHEEQFVAHLVEEKLEELSKTDQPWSLVASFWGPHQPYYPSESFASLIDPDSIPEYPSFKDNLSGRPLRHFLHRDFNHTGARDWKEWKIWQEILARCYAQALQLDDAIGNILNKLDEFGFSDNTLVVWCADHGDAVASHGGLWDKASTYSEEVARIPLAIRWPNKLASYKKVDKLVSNMDITATILDAAGVSIPEHMDSRSLLPLSLNSDDANWPDQLICEHHGHAEDIVQRIIIHGQYKYVAALYDSDEMYDLTKDPFEMCNIINKSEYKYEKEELRKRIIEHIEKTDDSIASSLAHSLRLDF